MESPDKNLKGIKCKGKKSFCVYYNCTVSITYDNETKYQSRKHSMKHTHGSNKMHKLKL